MDREKVINGLKNCSIQNDVGCQCCPYFEDRKKYGHEWCTTALAQDALALIKEQQEYIEYWSAKYDEYGKAYMKVRDERDALLKEQEAVEPIPYHRSDGTIFKYECRQCRTKIFKMDLFCRHCGQAVKWECLTTMH